MKSGNFSLQPNSLLTNACKRSLLATCSAVALALGIVACEQQGQQEAGMAEKGMEKVKQAGKKTMQEAETAGKKAMQDAKKATGKAMQGTKKETDKAMQGTKKETGKAMQGTKKETGKAMQGTKKAADKAMQGTKKETGKAMKKPSGETKGTQGTKPSAGSAPAGTTGGIATKAPSPKFLSLDINGDGQLSADETSGNVMLKNNITKLDADGDGQLSPSEFAGASGMMGSKKTGSAIASGLAGSSGGSTENSN